MPIFPKKSIKGRAMPKIHRKKKTFSYMDPLDFKRKEVSYSPSQIKKDFKAVIKRRSNLKKAASSEARAYFRKKKMSPTVAALRSKTNDFYHKLKK